MIGLALLAQLTIAVQAPDSVAACEPVEVSVAVRAPAREVPRILPPSFVPFDVLRSSAAPQITYEGSARQAVLAEYRFVIATDQRGTFFLPTFEARAADLRALSEARRITVTNERARGKPTIVARARVDTSLDVNFRAAAVPETVYVGQQTNYEVAVFLNQNVRERLGRNPTFFPPDIQSMLAYDLPTGADPPRRKIGSRCFDALVYQRALFPLLAGRFVVPPAQLVYALKMTPSIFSREETHELQTDAAVIVAIEPPARDRPADFLGAVGQLRVQARLDSTAARVGNPLTLTLRVSGTGNVKLFPRPQLEIPWAGLVRGDERVEVDTTAWRVGGAKEFDWVLTPRIAGELDVPPIRYSFFNPERRRYEAAATAPLHVRVASGALASADTARVDETLPLRTRYRGETLPPVHEHPIFWLLLVAAPLPMLAISARARRRVVPRTVVPATALRKLARETGIAGGDPPSLRRAFARALADRVSLPHDAFTRADALARGLRRAGVPRELALDAERLMRELDRAAYAPGDVDAKSLAERAVATYQRVDEEALSRSELRVPLGPFVLVLLFVGAATIAVAAAPPLAREAFDRGVAAYQTRDFPAARAEFSGAARLAPRSADAWANYGTAAWATGDTATAVSAWQRSLRLGPLAADMRERVQLVHATNLGSAAFVAPVPLALAFAIPLLLWCLAWAIAAWDARRGRARPRRAVVAGILVAAALMVVAFEHAERLGGRGVGVVRQPSPLNADPAFGGERGPMTLMGEVVRIRVRQGAWTRVALDDGRAGWVASDALLPVAATAPPAD